MKVYIETYGCSSNRADSEVMAGLLTQAGWALTRSAEGADLCLINTCVVKSPTLNRMIHRIRRLTDLDKPLIVAGCMTKTEREMIERISPRASMLGPDSIEKVSDVARAALSGRKAVCLEDLRRPKLCLPRVRTNPLIGIVTIAIGCRSTCAYCVTRRACGKLFSYPAKLIVDEIRRAVAEGCRELWLTCQDCGCWGHDVGLSLSHLLRQVVKIRGKFWVRVGMMNPAHVKPVLDELIEVYQSNKIYKFLHLPVQSGSDRILGLMQRGYTVKDFVHIVDGFRQRISRLTLATDVIVGFPGETERDFIQTLRLIRQVQPDVTNLSRFGPRAGTPAAHMAQLDGKTIKRRSKTAYRVIRQIALTRLKSWVGWTGEVLINERGDGVWWARNFAYRPLAIPSRKNLFGKWVKVKVVNMARGRLVGRLAR